MVKKKNIERTLIGIRNRRCWVLLWKESYGRFW